jgi:hypothetical protein
MQVSVAAAAAGCTPVRYVLHLYPDTFDGTDAGDRVLSAFARTVVPGIREDDANVYRALKDPDLPFHRYAGFLAADLDARARAAHGRRFVQLGLRQRTAVVERALEEGGTVGQLHSGAIFLTQVACYAGIYDAERGCPLIDFDGCYEFRGLGATTFPNPGDYLADGATPDGNPT